MKKKSTKSSTKKTATCACKVSPVKDTNKSISCSTKSTPIKATLESVITPDIDVQNTHEDTKNKLPVVGTVIAKRFKGKLLEILVAEDGLKYNGKTYKSLSGLAMEITGYPISGYVFFQKELNK